MSQQPDKEPKPWDYNCYLTPECKKNNCIRLCGDFSDYGGTLNRAKIPNRLEGHFMKPCSWEYLKSENNPQLFEGAYIIHDVANMIRADKEEIDAIVAILKHHDLEVRDKCLMLGLEWTCDLYEYD